MKRCRSCEQTKPDDEFYTGRIRCIVCIRKAALDYYRRNRERCKEVALARWRRMRDAA